MERMCYCDKLFVFRCIDGMEGEREGIMVCKQAKNEGNGSREDCFWDRDLNGKMKNFYL